MSKLITTRLEYVCFNDATLSNIPPTYPPPSDVYQAGVVATAADAYGILPIGSSGPAVLTGIPAGATCIVVGDANNTASIVLSQPAVPKTPTTAAAALNWAVQPGQIVTLPGVLNLGAITVQGVSTAGATTTNIPFACVIHWSV